MVTLNLTAMTTEEIILKDYLENNASEVLAEKINNGVRIEKDGITIINKKTLEHFMMDYAPKEAEKRITKQRTGVVVVPVYKDAIFNWLMHYFEEDSIEGILYNLDGTEYKPVKPVTQKTVSQTKAKGASIEPKVKPMSMFDIMQENKLADFKAHEPEVAELDVPESEDDGLDNSPPTEQELNEAPFEPEPEESDHEKTVPEFLSKLFGDSLKVEVA